ncbi:dehydrogenase [Desulfolithobacter dissulfuricans]|uniref:Dehydrogenase n=1 Tax=Desulfolithobacter dissulfuricans TaxID=2795293 RepID=A0A915TYS7_9BACT|nr:molecular chaperone TorD family protein [Desulfolithobacter dissulfuricans]BCO08268.1 dehydrogenase [Desulfolithobacter dissulfuricans]
MALAEMNSMAERKPLLSFLKRIFLKEIDKDILMDLQQIPVDTVSNDLDQGFSLITQAAKTNNSRMDDYLEELAVEFSRLFIGPTHPPAVPFASFYLSENRILMSEITIKVRKQYLEAGLTVHNLYQIPEDHISFEMEFMEYLIDRSLELHSLGDDEQVESLKNLTERFFYDHLTVWVPDFSDSIIEHTKEDFYQGAALILKETCSQDW